ncbi:MAG: 5-formyltetrahydrofolate cyclo-ligase [Pseudomonadota bacterium]
MSDNDPTDQKARLRRHMRDIRRIEMTRAGVASITEGASRVEHQMGAHLAAAGLIAPSDLVAGYMPIKDELDPLSVLSAVDIDCEIALPQMVGSDQPLVFRRWREGDPLVTTTWGIQEPDETCPVVSPSVLLVPLLAIDRAGYRVGYGGGFYDRTIAAFREAGGLRFTIGLAYDAQVLDAVPRDAYDEPVDYILTPTGLTAAETAGRAQTD